MGRIRGWPATLCEPDLLDAPVVLRPIRVSDARARRQVREEDIGWLRPWDPSAPDALLATSSAEPLRSMIWHSPAGPYVSVMRRRRWARRGKALIWAVRYGDQFAGQLSVWSITWGANHSAQVGYWVDERFAGRGIAPTALALAADFCFQVAGLHRLEASIQPGNAASRRVVEKLGFREEGLRVREVHIDGAWRDHVCYAITAEEAPYGLLPRWRHSSAVSRPGTQCGSDPASFPVVQGI
ncbi:MAG TPA: GNAT family protein [Trebonia sp.]|nr:GNAT family protein [Trebonia sp.]